MRLNKIDTGSETVVGAVAEPVADEGMDCEEYDVAVLYTSNLDVITSYDLEVWGKVGSAWFKLNGCAYTAIGNATWGERFMIEGLDRILLRVNSLTGTALDVNYRLVRSYQGEG